MPPCNASPSPRDKQGKHIRSEVSKPVHATEAAFLSLLETHQGILHKVCRMYARSEEARRDLFQDIVVQMWRAWPQFRQESKASTWMYRIALNVAVSGLRRSAPPTEAITEAQHRFPDAGPAHSGAVERLYAALEGLNKVEKSCVLLLLDDYSYEEMAAITGLDAGHLRVKMFRIRKKLQSLILGTIK
ncbi:MAG: sigma-70 family RNA polymerase sigma factor [Saprospiraceae bacterium]